MQGSGRTSWVSGISFLLVVIKRLPATQLDSRSVAGWSFQLFGFHYRLYRSMRHKLSVQASGDGMWQD